MAAQVYSPEQQAAIAIIHTAREMGEAAMAAHGPETDPAAVKAALSASTGRYGDARKAHSGAFPDRSAVNVGFAGQLCIEECAIRDVLGEAVNAWVLARAGCRLLRISVSMQVEARTSLRLVRGYRCLAVCASQVGEMEESRLAAGSGEAAASDGLRRWSDVDGFALELGLMQRLCASHQGECPAYAGDPGAWPFD
jgi:hypothetical protein